MTDFVFGGIEADEARLLANERAARAAIRHFQQIEPLDPLPGQPVTVTVQVGPEVVVDRVTLYYTIDGTNPQGEHGEAQNGAALQLEPIGVRWEPLIWDYVRLWQGQIPGQVDGTLVQYRIEGRRSYAEPNSVWSREINLDRTVERPALYGYWVDNQTVPAWAHEAIVYHVFVDRFAGLPDGAADRWLGPEEINDFVGGSIRGVIDSLDYIAGTGATALWLSPVFVTTTYHGYDTTDYYHVDPRFGTDADLVELFEQAHRRGLRVILDYVANHTSVDFAPFVEARSDANSRYRRWFSFDEAYKHGYRAFFDVAKMPQFNTEEPEVRAYLNHAAQHWLALGADGLRLDYAAGPNHLFWSAFRAACRSVKPDCWLFGEVTRAGDILRAYAGRLDGCLDFGFCRSIRMLAAGESPALSLGQFINQIAAGRRYFGPAAQDRLRSARLSRQPRHESLPLGGQRRQAAAAAGAGYPVCAGRPADPLLRHRGGAGAAACQGAAPRGSAPSDAVGRGAGSRAAGLRPSVGVGAAPPPIVRARRSAHAILRRGRQHVGR